MQESVKAPLAEHSGPHDAVCDTGQTCIGLGCRIRMNASRSADGTSWVSHGATLWFNRSFCRECRCLYPTWPWRHCDVTLVSTRSQDEIHGVGSSAGNTPLGFGSLVNGMLHTAAFALEYGFGFQPSIQTCPRGGARAAPFCYFAPVSACGSTARQVCHDRFCDALNVPFSRVARAPVSFRALPNRTRLCAAIGRVSSELAQDCAESELGMWRAVARLSMREQPELASLVDPLVAVQVQRSRLADQPFVALHVRRGDKHFESEPRDACDYADALAALLKRHSRLHDVRWTIFVASDEPTAIVAQLAACSTVQRHNWHLTAWSQGGVDELRLGARRDGDAQVRLWAELRLLARAAFVVCTFSSNVCRLVQLLRTQPAETLAPLDEGSGETSLRCPERSFCVGRGPPTASLVHAFLSGKLPTQRAG